MKFKWVTLVVNNFNETLKFYEEIVGLKLTRMFDSTNEGYRIAFLGDQSTQIEIIESNDLKNINMGKHICLGFTVDSLDDTIEYLQSKQVRIHIGPLQPSPKIKFIYVLDPNGLKVQFAQVLDNNKE